MAPRGKTVQLNSMFTADFETCDHIEKGSYSIDPLTEKPIYPQRVWLAGFKNLETMESTIFTSLDDFMKAILARGNNVNREYAFHNLKFDGSFIIPWLFENGFTHTHDKPKTKQFSTLISDRNDWYSITIQVTTKRRVTLWDTAKLFPCALEYMPDIYMTPTKKIREDSSFYTKQRLENYVPDERDLHYFENDLQVPAETLNRHIEEYGLRFKKTQASQSFYNFEQSFKAWKWRFPAVDDDVDKDIRQAYWGGISYVPPHKAGKDYYNIGSYDINSSYPDKIANFRMPYGDILYQFGEGQHPDMSKFWVAEALVTFELKDNECLPCIPKKAIIEGEILESKDSSIDKWLRDSQGVAKIRFSCIDYETFQSSYNFTVKKWNWSTHWAWKVHRELAAFINKNNDTKVKYSDLAKKATDPQQKAEYKTIANRAKIDNNSFYGKFGEEIIKTSRTPYFEDGEVTWSNDHEEVLSMSKRKFLPIAIAITAWGRQQLVHFANMMGEHFLYCDTDSIHFLNGNGGKEKIEKAVKKGRIKVHPTKLGAWDFEGNYTRGRYLRAKCYMEELEDGTRLATVAGLPPDKHTGQFSKSRSCLNWDNFHIGHEVHWTESNKLRTVPTPTGSKLIETGFIITEKETLNTTPTQKQIDKINQLWLQAIEKENDPIKDGVQYHGHIQCIGKDDNYYSEYKQMSRSVKSRYFRRNGIGIDVFADLINYDVDDLVNILLDK